MSLVYWILNITYILNGSITSLYCKTQGNEEKRANCQRVGMRVDGLAAQASVSATLVVLMINFMFSRTFLGHSGIFCRQLMVNSFTAAFLYCEWVHKVQQVASLSYWKLFFIACYIWYSSVDIFIQRRYIICGSVILWTVFNFCCLYCFGKCDCAYFILLRQYHIDWCRIILYSYLLFELNWGIF